MRSARFVILALFIALPLSAAEADKTRLSQEVRELRALQAASESGAVLLEQIVRSVPEHLWLEEMTFRAGRIQVSGQALNTNAIARFIETLDAVEAFDEPTLVDTTENPNGSSYSFTLSFRFFPVVPEETKVPLEQERDEISRRLARREDVPRVLDELRTIARDLDLGSSSFVEARAGDARSARVDVDVAATFHGLTMLFERLRRLSALTTLDELTVRQELTERGTIAASFRLRIPLRRPE
jgi:hypothetical protein